MSDPVSVRLCFHDRCFDGAASSAVFFRFYRERVNPHAEFRFTGMTHRAVPPFEEELFDGDENVIVDFKYSSSPRITWWFDHHQSAFLTPADAAHFRADRSGHKFYDPTYKSCTKLLADITSKQFGFDAAPLAELVYWGDVIDGAQFPSPEAAVGLAEPAMQLALVIEAAPEDNLVPRLIPEMATRSLAEMVKWPPVARHLGPLLERHRRSVDLLRKRAEAEDGVVFFDVSDLELEGYNKFIPYLLFPGLSVLRGCERVADPGEGLDRLESVERRLGGEKSGVAGGTVRRRRTPPRRGYFVRSRRPRARSAGRPGDRFAVARLKRGDESWKEGCSQRGRAPAQSSREARAIGARPTCGRGTAAGHSENAGYFAHRLLLPHWIGPLLHGDACVCGDWIHPGRSRSFANRFAKWFGSRGLAGEKWGVAVRIVMR